jgi:trehalose 6-phosphate phosphatase
VAALAALPGTSVAVVSGRPLESLRALLTPPPGVVLVGSHGAEIDADGLAAHDTGRRDRARPTALDDDEQRLLDRVRALVGAVVAAHPGTRLEVKPAAVALHTRGTERAQADAARSEVLAGPARLPGVHLLEGKEVLELAVTDATKGRALRRLRGELGLDHGGGFFAGDDTTDETAFGVLEDDAGDLGVKVGEGSTSARYRVPDPEALADVLSAMARLRG